MRTAQAASLLITVTAPYLYYIVYTVENNPFAIDLWYYSVIRNIPVSFLYLLFFYVYFHN